MKQYKLIIAAALMGAVACKKTELDLFPYNQVETTQAFNTETDVNLAINGMYTGFRVPPTGYTNAYFIGQWNIVADALSDNLIIMQAGRQTLKTFGEWKYTGEDTYRLFDQGYSITRRANAILENIGKFPDGAFKDNAKGEALAVRALTYFDMSRVYGKTFQNATNTGSILPYVTTTDATILPSRESVQGFYDKVIADFTQAQTLINSSNGIGRLNKAAVAGLLSRVYLYKGDWAACIQAANTTLTLVPKISWPAINTFPKVWTDESDSSVLFKVVNTNIDNINTPGVNYYQIVTGGIKSEYVVEYNFRQLFKATDVRTSSYIQTSAYNGVNYNHVVKWAKNPGKPAGVMDFKVIRMAEVLLNRAEAYYRNNNQPAALTDLNLLRANRYSDYAPFVGTGQALLDEILKERRLELAFEGDRFWDLKRRNAPVQRDPTKGDRADGTGVVYVKSTLPAGDFHFQLAYPQGELNYNTNLKQNPQY